MKKIHSFLDYLYYNHLMSFLFQFYYTMILFCGRSFELNSIDTTPNNDIRNTRTWNKLALHSESIHTVIGKKTNTKLTLFSNLSWKFNNISCYNCWTIRFNFVFVCCCTFDLLLLMFGRMVWGEQYCSLMMHDYMLRICRTSVWWAHQRIVDLCNWEMIKPFE